MISSSTRGVIMLFEDGCKRCRDSQEELDKLIGFGGEAEEDEGAKIALSL